MTTPALHRMLVTSVGNPAPYTNTPHSAGHLVLQQIVALLAPEQPGLGTHGSYRGGRASVGLQHTFYQPSASMNVSGPPIARGWHGFRATLSPAEKPGARLVVLHDELEASLGRLKVKTGSTSVRGHNGLKSLAAALPAEWPRVLRIGIGIGRPDSRDPAAVSAYVLRKLSMHEADALRRVAEDVLVVLTAFEEGKGF